jgi:D-sedoheptulose 7-phosphate isomerase
MLMWETPEIILDDLIKRRPELKVCKQNLQDAYLMLLDTVQKGGTIFTCGNGGSAADAEHIVGELLKGFMKGRKLDVIDTQAIEKMHPGEGEKISKSLQKSIRAISLTSHISLMTAFMNDVDPSFVFAQQLRGLGKANDTLIAISTSGNSENIINACKIAKVQQIKTIGLSGATGGKLNQHCDLVIKAPENVVPLIQELHLPIYHALCAMLEVKLFS